MLGKFIRKHLFFPSAKKSKQGKIYPRHQTNQIVLFLVSSSSLKVILENKAVCFETTYNEKYLPFFPFRKVPVLYPKLTEVTEVFCSDFRVL